VATPEVRPRRTEPVHKPVGVDFQNWAHSPANFAPVGAVFRIEAGRPVAGRGGAGIREGWWEADFQGAVTSAVAMDSFHGGDSGCCQTVFPLTSADLSLRCPIHREHFLAC